MYVMVLDDGETFAQLDGCRIMEFDDELSVDDIDQFLSLGESVTLVSFRETVDGPEAEVDLHGSLSVVGRSDSVSVRIL